MKNKKCYGWTNKQTWNISLLYEETFDTLCEEQRDDFTDINSIVEAFKSLVYDTELEGLKEWSLANETVREYLEQVNWEEIAKRYVTEFDLH